MSKLYWKCMVCGCCSTFDCTWHTDW